jgi:hypothetical protein
MELKTPSEPTQSTSASIMLEGHGQNEQVASISKGRLYILVFALGITNLAIALDGSILGQFDHCDQSQKPSFTLID